MTVPPNYGPPPEQPHTPGHGYQSPYNGGQNPYGSQPQQPAYGSGGQPPYGQEPPSPYGGPVLPPEPPKRNLGLIGGVIVGVTVLVLGATLLVTMNLRGNEDDTAGEDPKTSGEASEEATSPEEAATTEEEATSEVGQCLPYEPEIQGDGLALVDCGDATAFWEITGQSYDVTDVPVDDEGNLTDTAKAVELCGEDWGVNYLGELWTNWHYVYSSGTLDSLYCIKATGAADPNEPDHLPYTPDVGDCFDEASEWWTVDCASDLAVYEVVDTVIYDDPVEMSEDEAKEAATCGGDWYWQVTDNRNRTSAIICADEL
jgi:hypothetical protein